MIGLFAFFYAACTSDVQGVDQFFDWRAIVADVVKRKFITIGMLAFACSCRSASPRRTAP
jgi:sulfoxide reductase heme-binding subunit YedZ